MCVTQGFSGSSLSEITSVSVGCLDQVKSTLIRPKTVVTSTKSASQLLFKIMCLWQSPTSELSLNLVDVYVCDPKAFLGAAGYLKSQA